MRVLRRSIAVFAAVIVAMASGALVAHGDSTPSVYTTPGGHIAGGRQWNTSCEMYSSNVVRCRTEIWATTVTYREGRYVQRTGWTFNNLSYLPSPRASWAGNNLGNNNPNWTSGGRQWRTECDTPATGRGACRSYAMVNVVAASGGSYVNTKKWVFNNVVLFSSSTVPAVSTVPSWVVDCPGQWLEPKGLRCSPIRVGNDAHDLRRLGYVYEIVADTCTHWESSASLTNRGISAGFAGDNLRWVSALSDYIPTTAGARVGMTVAEVRALHGAEFTVVPKVNYGETQYFGTVREGEYELQFRVPGQLVDEVDGVEYYAYAPTRPLVDDDVIVEISAQRYTDDVSWDGC